MTVGLAAVTARAARGRVAVAWLVPLVAAGFFWYARNLFRTGNPLPWFELGVGPLSLAAPPQLQGLTVAHYATDSEVWRTVFFPGLHDRFGTVWVAVFALALAGMALSIALGRSRLHRVLGAAAVVGVVAYMTSPGTAAGPEGFPIFFSATARYVDPALALGLALLPLVPRLDALARRWWVIAGLAVLLAATLTNQGVTPLDASRAGFAIACAALLAGAAALAGGRRAVPRAALSGAVGVVALVAVVGGWAVTDAYLGDRYSRGELSWARDLEDSRIALALLVAALLTSLGPRASKVAVIVLLAAVAGAGLRSLDPARRRPATPEVASYIERVAAPGDPVLYGLGEVGALGVYLGEDHPVEEDTADRSVWRRAAAGGDVFLVRGEVGALALMPRYAGPGARFALRGTREFAGLRRLAVGRYSGGRVEGGLERERGREVIEISPGRDLFVQPGLVRGFREQFQAAGRLFTVTGWGIAADESQAVDAVFAFVRGRLVGVATPTVLRGDVERVHGYDVSGAGFVLQGVVPEAGAAGEDDVRVFGVVGTRASEIPPVR